MWLSAIVFNVNGPQTTSLAYRPILMWSKSTQYLSMFMEMCSKLCYFVNGTEAMIVCYYARRSYFTCIILASILKNTARFFLLYQNTRLDEMESFFLFFALLLSSVLDGFDQLIKLFLHCPCCQLTWQHQKNFLELWYEPGPAGRGAWTLPLCYADPHEMES